MVKYLREFCSSSPDCFKLLANLLNSNIMQDNQLSQSSNVDKNY